MSNKYHIISPFETDYSLKSALIRIQEGSGGYGEVRITGSYFPMFSGTIEGTVYEDFSVKMTDKLNSVGGYTYDISWNPTDNRFILSSSVAPNWSFNSYAQQIFGVSSSYSSTKVITGSKAPYFVFKGTRDDIARSTEEYHVAPIDKQRFGDTGRSYAVGNMTPIKALDFQIYAEPPRKIFNQSATLEDPYTFQKWIKHTKTTFPFVVFRPFGSYWSESSGSTGIASIPSYSDRWCSLRLKAEETMFSPQRLDLGNWTWWNHSVNSYLIDRPQILPGGNLATTPPVVPDWIVATGGTIVTSSIAGTNYAVHTFDTVGSGSFIVNSVGTTQNTVEYLVGAGGGGGGGSFTFLHDEGHGGGGGGGILAGSATVTSLTTFDIVVGALGTGGIETSRDGKNGGNSDFDSFATAIGGGGGVLGHEGLDGGSGGGSGGEQSTNRLGGDGVVGQGNNGGGDNSTVFDERAGGGGGGWGGAGSNGGGGAGHGGAGGQDSITGTAVYYGAGGGGSEDGYGNGPGLGGTGGGGAGGAYQVNGSDATGLCAGGGGAGASYAGFKSGGDGTDGIIIIRYPIE